MLTITPYDPRRLYGCIVGAYTCVSCNSPSVAAIDNQGKYIPVCTHHALQAEREGLQVLRSLVTVTGKE